MRIKLFRCFLFILLEENLAVVLDDLAVLEHHVHDGLFICAVLKFHGHFEQHEVDAGVLDARGLFRGELHLGGAVGAVDFDLVGLLHEGSVLSEINI